MVTISIIVPCYDEEDCIYKVLELLEKLKLEPHKKEVIVVDDGSIDKTKDEIERFITEHENSNKWVRFYQHSRNLGKGAAVRTGINRSKGKIIIIQDADLEYYPKDIPRLMKPIITGEVGVVFGSRWKGMSGKGMSFSHNFGNKVLSWATTILFREKITDMMTGYKLIRKDILKKITLYSRGFEFEPEITSKILMLGYKIIELPITYQHRQKGEAKISWRDGIYSLVVAIKCRLNRFKGK